MFFIFSNSDSLIDVDFSYFAGVDAVVVSLIDVCLRCFSISTSTPLYFLQVY